MAALFGADGIVFAGLHAGWLMGALNRFPQMSGARTGMGRKADFAANIWVRARNSTLQTARVRVSRTARNLFSALLVEGHGVDQIHRALLTGLGAHGEAL